MDSNRNVMVNADSKAHSPLGKTDTTHIYNSGKVAFRAKQLQPQDTSHNSGKVAFRAKQLQPQHTIHNSGKVAP